MHPPVLILPGWLGSGAGHWQSRWEGLYGDKRVEQHEWQHPLRGDWMIQLEEAVLAATGPVLLAAHSLGCVLVAAWATHSAHYARVAGALLVAPPDLTRPELAAPLRTWSPIPRQRLPFAARVVASRDDPYGSFEHAAALAGAWGAALTDAGCRGHLNADSGLGDWPEGRALLRALVVPATPSDGHLPIPHHGNS